MTLNFYTLGVIYLIYSFLGWVGETIVATIKGKSFANRGAAAGPFCFVYGTTAVLLAAGYTDLLVSYTYRIAFEGGGGQDFGLAAAIATLIFLLVGALAIVNLKATRMKFD